MPENHLGNFYSKDAWLHLPPPHNMGVAQALVVRKKQ